MIAAVTTDPVKPDPADRMAELYEQVARHDEAYYEKDAPEIPDSAYDDLLRELRTLEDTYPELVRADTPTAGVGGAPNQQFAPVEHRQRMMSLDNSFDCLLYTSPSPRDATLSRMPSSA